jgi:copper chaperone
MGLEQNFCALEQGGVSSPNIPDRKHPTMNHLFFVHGMSCGHCEKAVTSAILQLDPQAQVRIDRSQNRVEVDTEQPREALAEAIREEGYTVAA